jgi:cell division protease FtsH
VALAEARASVILRANWGAVGETARVLMERETLSGVALDAVLSTVRPTNVEDMKLPDDPRSTEHA